MIALRLRMVRLVAIAVVVLLFGFNSYKYPFERITKDANLRAYVEAQVHSGNARPLYAEHYEITMQCLHDAHVKPELAEAIGEKVSDIDLDNWHNASHYEAKNHCDRAIGVSSASAFENALTYHRERIAEAWNSLGFGDVENVVKILPRALHAEQDFFSHSNFVDLPTERQIALSRCWTAYGAKVGRGHHDTYREIEQDRACMGDATLSDSLLITGFDPKASDPYFPPGDTYPHRTFAKDSATYSKEAARLMPDGSTSRYLGARLAAVRACTATLNDFKRLCQMCPRCRGHVADMFQ